MRASSRQLDPDAANDDPAALPSVRPQRLQRPRRTRVTSAASPAAAAAWRETEASFMRRIMEYAQLRGWQVFHDEHSLWNERGLPDLILTRWPRQDDFARLVFAEIKVSGGKLRVEQTYWIETLRHVPGVEVFVWRPADWDNIQRTLF